MASGISELGLPKGFGHRGSGALDHDPTSELFPNRAALVGSSFGCGREGDVTLVQCNRLL